MDAQCAAILILLKSSAIITAFASADAIRTGIEVVITALTRNQVYPHGYRGFESHPVRQKNDSFQSCRFLYSSQFSFLCSLFTRRTKKPSPRGEGGPLAVDEVLTNYRSCRTQMEELSYGTVPPHQSLRDSFPSRGSHICPAFHDIYKNKARPQRNAAVLPVLYAVVYPIVTPKPPARTLRSRVTSLALPSPSPFASAA